MKFYSHIIKMINALSSKANTEWKTRSDNMDDINANPNMPEHCGSSTDREADKKCKLGIITNISQ